MFSIYDYDGRVFRNTLEELYKVNPVDRSPASLEPKNHGLSHASHIQSHIPNKSSIDAYKNLIHANPKDELRHAYEIMQEEFEVLKEGQTVYEGLNLLSNSGNKVIPVTTANNRIVGLFDPTSVIKNLIDNDENSPNLRITPVREFLAGKVITAEPVTSIRRIAEVMHHYNLVLVPVVDAYDALIGVISSRDIARAIANDPPISLWT